VPLVLDDFEAGVGKWTLNDSAADEGGGTPRLCSIMATREVPPDSTGQQSGAIRFLEAERGWASVSIPVDGPALARSGLGQVAFWVRGERDGPRVEVAFRAVYDNPATGHRDLDVAYETQLALDDPEWRLVAIPFRRFETEFGKPLGPSDLTHITLFQFVQKPSVAPS
jgi:hypothetical protein